MPKALHDKLKTKAKSKGLTGKKAAAYIYGTFQDIEKKGGLKKTRRKKSSVAIPR